MPEFVYDDDEPRLYNAFGDVERGTVITADEAPDTRWTQRAAKASKTTTTPAEA